MIPRLDHAVVDLHLLLDDFRRNRRSRASVLALLEFNPSPAARELIERMRRCRRGQPCKIMSCPRCGRKASRGEVRRALKDSYALAEGVVVREAVSFVTLKPKLATGADLGVRHLAAELKKRVRYFQRHSLPTTSWSGYLEIGLEHADLHLHVVVHHPVLPRSELIDILKDEFAGPREVVVSDWRADQTMFEALRSVFEYSTKHLPAIKGSALNPVVAPRLLAEYVVNRQLLSPNFVGVRFKINMRSDFRWRAGVLHGPRGVRYVDLEMEDFILRGRGTRRLPLRG